MKKILKVSALLLAVGLLLSSIGVFLARRDNVNSGSLLGIAESSFKLTESEISVSVPEPQDISGVEGASERNDISYELNEFNTLSLYGEALSVEFTAAQNEQMKIRLDSGSLTTAVTGGKLCIQAVGNSRDSTLTVGVPLSFKGGLDISGKQCRINMDSFESAMDMSLCFHESSFEAKNLSADSVTILTSSSSVKADEISSVEDVKITAVSSNYRIENVSAVSSSVEAENCTLAFGIADGAFSADLNSTSFETSFKHVGGNISLDMTACSATVFLPKDAEITLKNEETYALLTNKSKAAQNNDANKPGRYTIETNIKYGIVTLENLK